MLGLFILALGVSISKASLLGVSPINAIPAVQSTILSIDMGICTTVFFILFIGIQIVILRKEFRLVNLFQIIPSFLFGFFVSATSYLCELALPATENYIISLIYLLISIVFVAMGILLYLNAEIISLPAEGLMQAIAYKVNLKFSTVKIAFDWTVIIIAAILSLLYLDELNGIREGTVVAAFGVGICLKWLESFIEMPLRKFLYGFKQVAKK